jgi:hypothetical protein
LYTRWTTLRQEIDQTVLELTNVLHTLHTNMGITYSERHLVLKYRGGLHRYIQTEMDFLDISSLGAAYRYAIKIEQKIKQKTPNFESRNLSQYKQSKGNSNPQNKGQRKYGKPHDIQSKPQAKKDNGKMKKDIGKWCDFHKSPWHNTIYFRSK